MAPRKRKNTISPEQFLKWLEEMRSAGLAASDADCGRQLGKSTDRIVHYKNHGCDLTIGLAMKALLHRFEPYS